MVGLGWGANVDPRAVLLAGRTAPLYLKRGFLAFSQTLGFRGCEKAGAEQRPHPRRYWALKNFSNFFRVHQ